MITAKVKKAIELQEKANLEIDMYGETTIKTFNKMMKAFDSLTHEEIDLVLAATSGRVGDDVFESDEFEF
jgi:hypothetical protein